MRNVKSEKSEYNKFMYKFLLILVFAVLFLPVCAGDYNVYHSTETPKITENERILFILDFSNSMSEFLEGRKKVDLMTETMKNLLANLSPNISVGLRVYGHRMGFTPMEACRASSLVAPVIKNNSVNIQEAFSGIKPIGMTLITYSLKQAVKKDFLGYSGKKHIILLTDGGENCDESPCAYVMELIKVRKDIKIDVIAFNIDDEDDLAQLQCTSLVTSGKFYNAQTSAELVNSLNNSVSGLKEVEAKILK